MAEPIHSGPLQRIGDMEPIFTVGQEVSIITPEGAAKVVVTAIEDDVDDDGEFCQNVKFNVL